MPHILQGTLQYCSVWDTLGPKIFLAYIELKFNRLSCILSGNLILEILKSDIHIVSYTNLGKSQSSGKSVCQNNSKLNLEDFRETSMVCSNILKC